MNKQNSKMLQELYLINLRKQYPTFPEFALPPKKYTDATANGLTTCIIDFINFSGHQAERISSTGLYRDNTKIVTDVIGRQRTIGKGKWTPGTSTKGTADISATINGKSVKIEVKIGNDKQSEAQKQYEINVNKAGGIYLIAKTFDEFIINYENMITPKNVKLLPNKEGDLVYISGITTTEIIFKRVKDNTFYNVPYNPRIVALFE